MHIFKKLDVLPVNKLFQANCSKISPCHSDPNLNLTRGIKTKTEGTLDLFFLSTLILLNATAPLPLLIFKEFLFTNELLLSLQSNSFFIGNINSTTMKANVKRLQYAIKFLAEREKNPNYVLKFVYDKELEERTSMPKKKKIQQLHRYS